MEKQEIINLLKKTGDIPSLPDIIQKVNRTVADGDSTSGQLGSIIEKDQALTSKMLRLANSSYYGLSCHVDSISRAITILGFNSVSNIALTVSVGGMFEAQEQEGAVNLKELWAHSLACGVGAKVVMSNTNNSLADKAFLGGILHDIGKILINMKFQKEEEAIIASVSEERLKLLDAEKQVIGFTHTEIGAIMGKMWNFPNDIVEGIRHHHNPQRAGISPEIASAVHMGNEIVKAMGLGKSTEPCVMTIVDWARNSLNVSAEELPKIVCAIHDEFYLATEFMNL